MIIEISNFFIIWWREKQLSKSYEWILFFFLFEYQYMIGTWFMIPIPECFFGYDIFHFNRGKTQMDKRGIRKGLLNMYVPWQKTMIEQWAYGHEEWGKETSSPRFWTWWR